MLLPSQDISDSMSEVNGPGKFWDLRFFQLDHVLIFPWTLTWQKHFEIVSLLQSRNLSILLLHFF